VLEEEKLDLLCNLMETIEYQVVGKFKNAPAEVIGTNPIRV
jgi:hypothetical protein